MKKVLCVNGSPRKKWNSATLLDNAAKGAQSSGAAVETVHLYDYAFKGCVSCFACKINGGKSYGKCAYKDELSPILEKFTEADAVIISSPVYFGSAPGSVLSFTERVLFPSLIYTNPFSSIFPGKKKIGLIFSMNINTRELMEQSGLLRTLTDIERRYTLAFGSAESLYVMNTLQFEDYSQVTFDFLPVSEIERTRKEVFPIDCGNAYELGKRLTE